MELCDFFGTTKIFFWECFRTSNAFGRPGNYSHRVRLENLERLGQKIDQKASLGRFLEHFEIGRPKFLRYKIWKFFIENFHWKLYENEKNWDRKFSFFYLKNFNWNFNENVRKFFDLKIFRMSISTCSNCFRFQWKVLIFLKIFEIENFRKFSISKIFIFIQFSMKIFEIFRSKIFEIFDLKKFHFHTNFNENFRNFFDLNFFSKFFKKLL